MNTEQKIIEKDIRVENLMELWTTNVCEKVMRDYLGALIGNFDKTQSATREEERAKCRDLLEEVKGSMKKEKNTTGCNCTDIADHPCSIHGTSSSGWIRVATNKTLSTCISILEDKLKEL